MKVEDNPYAQALLLIHKQLIQEIVMSRSVFMREALASGRHTPQSLADLFEDTCSEFEGYAGSTLPALVEQLRTGQVPRPGLTVIDGGLSDD